MSFNIKTEETEIQEMRKVQKRKVTLSRDEIEQVLREQVEKQGESVSHFCWDIGLKVVDDSDGSFFSPVSFVYPLEGVEIVLKEKS